jgi:glutathione S-transferase
MATPTLITISFSHFCEKARWALERAGIAYREDAHLPALHVPAVKRAKGNRPTPVLVTDDGVLTDSTDILAWVDRTRPAAKLFGEGAESRAEITALEDRFDEDLGPHARRWAYAHILPDSAFMHRMFATQTMTPKRERVAMRVLFPLARLLMKRAMHIDAAGAARSIVKVEEVFEEVARRLADGRRYLVGDSFTAADLTFAALSSPVLLPDGARLPTITEVSPLVAARIRSFREHPAGVFALRVRREHRDQVAPGCA